VVGASRCWEREVPALLPGYELAVAASKQKNCSAIVESLWQVFCGVDQGRRPEQECYAVLRDGAEVCCTPPAETLHRLDRAWESGRSYRPNAPGVAKVAKEVFHAAEARASRFKVAMCEELEKCERGFAEEATAEIANVVQIMGCKEVPVNVGRVAAQVEGEGPTLRHDFVELSLPEPLAELLGSEARPRRLRQAFYDQLLLRVRAGPGKSALNAHGSAGLAWEAVVIWRALVRYHACVFGASCECVGWQLAAPPAAMRVLRDKFGVSHECFASPFNCFFPSFSSVFPDTDWWFGSRGNFSTLLPKEGSFEANPPFDPGVMATLTAKVIRSLEGVSPRFVKFEW